MRNYTAFLKKEIMESYRTYKATIMLIIFLIFGIISPLTAKMIPDLLGTFMPEGVSITLADPVALDSWAQFYKNIPQMGLIVTVILFSGILSAELSKGTLIIMLTKGLSRVAVILAKFTCMALIWTLSLALSFVLTWSYTVFLFPGGETAHLLFSVFCLWLFGVFLLALLIFAATLVNSNYGCLLITGAGVIVCILINIIPEAHRYNPITLATQNMNLLMGAMDVQSLLIAVAITAGLSLIFLISAVMIFRKKRL